MSLQKRMNEDELTRESDLGAHHPNDQLQQQRRGAKPPAAVQRELNALSKRLKEFTDGVLKCVRRVNDWRRDQQRENSFKYVPKDSFIPQREWIASFDKYILIIVEVLTPTFEE